MNIAGVAGYIDATMIKVADGLALTAGTVQCFVQRKSDSKWLWADASWNAAEPTTTDIPTMTHWKGGEWRLAHTPAAANDVYTISAVDSPVTCYPDNRVEHVRLPGAEDATVAKTATLPTAVFAYVAENGKTVLQMLRIMFAALAGKSSSGGKNFRDDADTKNRIAATIDANGDRTSVALDGD